ncbi:MAG TPA: hypothetical protein VJ302_04435 [Blastocatellia bacterium]|nr:hypothetical protein [Blastocatellia bacterium]
MRKSISRLWCGLMVAAVILSAGLSSGPLGLEWMKVSARTNFELVSGAMSKAGAPLDPFHRVAVGTITTVNAFSYVSGPLALESIVAAFGSGLSNSTVSAPAGPLPTTLGGTAVVILDSLGLMREAGIFFVSPTQINHQIPPGTPLGPATLIYTNTVSGERFFLDIEVSNVSPGLSTANSSGSGIANAFVLRVRADGTQNYEPVFEVNQGQVQAVPIDLGLSTDKVYLGLLGTGFRYRSALSAVTAAVGGTSCEVSYAGSQMQNIGLDQANVLLSRSLAGRGLVNVAMTVDGKPTNVVQINIR